MKATRKSPLGPRKTPLQARSRQTRDAIVRAAAQVFARHGHAAGTTNRIAERAGVSIGSLYEYFPNKDAILVALVEEHLDEIESAMAALVEAARRDDRDLGATIRGFVAAMVGMHARDPSLHRVLFEEAPLPPWLRRRLADLEQASAREVEALLRRRRSPVPDPALSARLVV